VCHAGNCRNKHCANYVVSVIMRTGHPRVEETSTGVDLSILFAVWALVSGLVGFGFYELMQPRQMPNPGLAAYRAPPGTVISYPATAQFSYGQPSIPPVAASDETSEGAAETTDRAVQALASAPKSAQENDAKPAILNAKRTTTTKRTRERTASARAQQRPSTQAQQASATYPGYAAVQ
jgi:hypothetical protein